jgi:pimeloyl-ACP methyl ester carboxylesterase
MAELPRLEPINSVATDALHIGYHETGAPDGPVVILLHGFPFDIHTYVDVVPILVGAGMRVIVPYLRGHGTTHITNPSARSGQQAAIGKDVVALMDALSIPCAILAGYDWGGRAACVAAALWPERVAGLVSVGGYLIEDIAAAANPADPLLESGLWFFFYFSTERGRRGLRDNRREITRLIWSQLSPAWLFDDATFDRTAAAFDNDDYVDVSIHSFRHRLGLAPGVALYDDIEKKLETRPPIAVPAITMEGRANGVRQPVVIVPTLFTGHHVHRTVQNAGHNFPQEAPQPFAAAVVDVASLA